MKKRKAEPEEVWAAAFCYVLAPVLLSYVLWVLEDALESGKKRLYFLARDGCMMYRMAEYLCRQWGIPLECRYLYCSRYALRSGEYGLLGDKCLDYICLGGMEVTLEKMMERGGLTAEEVSAAGERMGWESRMRKCLSYEQVKALKPQLKDNSFFMEKLLEHSKEAYPSVSGYLRQEGLLEEISYAIVDSGWTGSVQRSINRLLGSAGYDRAVEGYYFGLYEYVEGVEPEHYRTWYFAPENRNIRKAFFCNNLFECVFSSPEGMTKGYCRKEGRFEPVFAMEENPNRRRIEAAAGLLLRYVKRYAAGEGKGMPVKEKGFSIKEKSISGKHGAGTQEKEWFGKKEQREMERRTAFRLLASFMGRPSAAEARVFGSYVFDDDVTGEERRTVARAFTPEEVKEGRLFRRLFRYAAGGEHPAVQSAWPEAGMVLADAAGSTALYKFLLYSKKSLEQRKRNRKRKE